MSDPKDTSSFFRKVVKFVANPGTDWTEIATPVDEARENEFARGELKAMIERKRRNDFVRKREFDMLRKVRREGLTSEQLAALGGATRLEDSELRAPDNGARAESGVKAKIDEIEQQMVGDAAVAARAKSAHEELASSLRRPAEFYNAPTEPVPMEMSPLSAGQPAPSRAERDIAGRVDGFFPDSAPPAYPASGLESARAGSGASNGIRLDDFGVGASLGQPFTPQPLDVEHDPELDEAVIAFANADFEQAENALFVLTTPGGPRARHPDTWLVLFDLYRAVGQQHKFESLALDYAQQFGWSAPQWFSMPRMVAELAVDERPRNPLLDGQIGWASPEHIDAEVVQRLMSQALQMPLPWVFDWGRLRSIDAEACARLSELFRKWIGQDLEMRWLQGDRLFYVLAETAPTGVRDADPAYWQLRLDGLRMANRPDQFDEAAIDYCVTYEVSPPSWEKARCQVRISGSGPTTASPPMSLVSDGATSFMESGIADDPVSVQVGSVELSGQLIGDIGPILARMDRELGQASIVNVSCARLIRVDFIAAGDLLNWVLARRAEDRTVRFLETHRMVALFFGAMGINEHATVKVRTV